MVAEVKSLLDYIGGAEAPRGYGDVYARNRSGLPKPLTEMTLSEVLEWQKKMVADGSPSSAVGRYQIINSTLSGLVGELGLSGNEPFDEALQDRLGTALLKRRGLDAYNNGQITPQEFGNRLAQEWAGLPVLSPMQGASRMIERGMSYYSGDGLNASTVRADEFEALLGGGAPVIRASAPAPAPSQTPARRTNYSMQLPIYEDPMTGRVAPGFRTDGEFERYINPGWWSDFADAWVDTGIVRAFRAEDNLPLDPDFEVYDMIVQRDHVPFWRTLRHARSEEDYRRLLGVVERELERERRLSTNNRFFAPLLGYMVSPDGLLLGMLIPASRGLGFVRASARIGAQSLALESSLEALRASNDPNSTDVESIVNIGMGTVFAAGLAGAIGSIKARRINRPLSQTSRAAQEAAADVRSGRERAQRPAAATERAQDGRITVAEARSRIEEAMAMARALGDDDDVRFILDRLEREAAKLEGLDPTERVAPPGALRAFAPQEGAPRADRPEAPTKPFEAEVDEAPGAADLDEDAALRVAMIDVVIADHLEEVTRRIELGEITDKATSERLLGTLEEVTRLADQARKDLSAGKSVPSDRKTDELITRMIRDILPDYKLGEEKSAAMAWRFGPEARRLDPDDARPEAEIEDEIGREMDNEFAAVMGRGAWTTQIRFNGENIRIRRKGLPIWAPEAARRAGVFVSTATREVYIDPKATAVGFRRKIWRTFGLDDDQIRNPDEWAEFLVRFSLKLDELGQSPSFVGPRKFVIGRDGTVVRVESVKDLSGTESRRSPDDPLKGKTYVMGTAKWNVEADGRISGQRVLLDLDALRVAFERKVWRQDRGDVYKGGVVPAALPHRDFVDFEDYVDFVIEHERMHLLFTPDETHLPEAVIEALTNRRALEALGFTDPEAGFKMRAEQREARQNAIKWAEKELEDWRRGPLRRSFKNRIARALDRMVPSFYKNIHRRSLSESAKDLVDMLAADASLYMLKTHAGSTLGPSIEMEGRLWWAHADWLHRRETKNYEDYLGRGHASVVDMSVPRSLLRTRANGAAAISPEEFSRKAALIHITGDTSIAGGEAAVLQHAKDIGEFFNRFDGAARRNGLYQPMTPELQDARLQFLQQRLDRLEATRNPTKSTVEEIGRVERMIDDLQAAKVLPEGEASEADYFTRVFDKRMMERYPKTIRRILREAFLENDTIAIKDENGKWTTVRGNPATVDKRVDAFIKRMLMREANEAIHELAENVGRVQESPHPVGAPLPARQRILGIANKKLVNIKRSDVDPDERALMESETIDFIETNPSVISQFYARRMGHLIEYAKRFGDPVEGVTPDEGFRRALIDVMTVERNAWKEAHGGSTKGFKEHWDLLQRDLIFGRDRVMGRVVLEPSRMDNRVARVMKNWTYLAYLGMSGLVTTIDAFRTVNAVGLDRVFRHTMLGLDKGTRAIYRRSAEEGRAAGVLTDVTLGTVARKLTETALDPIYMTKFEKAAEWLGSKSFLFNLMAPITLMMREMSSSIGQHQIIDYALKAARSQASPEEMTYLRAHGLTDRVIRAIEKEHKAGRIERFEDIWLANTDAWADDGARTAFRAALGAMVDNTILVATAADKPTIFDGAIHIPKGRHADKLAEAFSWTDVGGYWRVQSGLASMPFWLMNYAVSATQKIAIPLVENPNARAVGTAIAMLGAGYIVAAARTPEFAWDNLGPAEKMMRALDQSGVAGVVPEVLWAAQGASIGVTGVNPFFFDPRFNHMPGSERLYELLGPGAQIPWNIWFGAAEAAQSGNTAQLSLAVPFRNHFMFGNFVKGLVTGDPPV